MCINYNNDIIRSLFAIVLGLMLSKYTTYSFNFEIPIIALATITSMDYFSIKIFIKDNWWLVASTALGVIVTQIFNQRFLLFYIFTFGIFFTCFYYMNEYPKGAPNVILGYSFTTVYTTYKKINMSIMVYDIFIVTVLGGILGFLILLIYPKERLKKTEINSPSLKVKSKNIKTILIVTTIIFIAWMTYIIFDIKDTFFAYAALAGIYGNINIDKIHKLTPINIGIHLFGCLFATIYSFFIIGLNRFFLLFALSLSVLFFPMIYFKYYGKSNIIKSISNGLIGATIMPLALYLTPYGDITSKTGARVLQITTMLIISLIITRILIFLQGETDG